MSVEMQPAETEESYVGWVTILERLEADVEAAATLVAGHAGTADAEISPEAVVPVWAPPADPGPMPGELEDRARRILTIQQELIRRLQAAQDATGRQLTALRRVPERSPGRSVYLDVTG